MIEISGFTQITTGSFHREFPQGVSIGSFQKGVSTRECTVHHIRNVCKSQGLSAIWVLQD